MNSLRGFVVGAVLILYAPVELRACVCIRGDPKSAFKGADAVFLAEVLDFDGWVALTVPPTLVQSECTWARLLMVASGLPSSPLRGRMEEGVSALRNHSWMRCSNRHTGREADGAAFARAHDRSPFRARCERRDGGVGGRRRYPNRSIESASRASSRTVPRPST